MAKKVPKAHTPHWATYTGYVDGDSGVHEDHAPEGVRKLWGTEFPHGKAVYVTDPKFVKKLEALQEFHVVKVEGELPVAAAPKAEVPGLVEKPEPKKGRFGKKADAED